MNPRLGAAILALCYLLGTWVDGHSTPTPTPTTVETEIGTAISIVCEEDQPCWDCTTMGNQICGAVRYINGMEAMR